MGTKRPNLLRLAARALPLAVAWVGLLAVLILAGEAIAHSATVTHFDRHATAFVVAHRSTRLDSVMKTLTWMGSWVSVALAGGLLATLVLFRRLSMVIVLASGVAWLGEFGGVNIAKIVVGRQRPPEAIWLVKAHGWSFPSGHAATATLVFTTLALVLTRLVVLRIARGLIWLAAVLAVAVTAFSRVELGVHWTTDVLAGVVFVASWTAVVLTMFKDSLPPCRSNRDAGSSRNRQPEADAPTRSDPVRVAELPADRGDVDVDGL